MWRMGRGTHLRSHAVVSLQPRGARVTWFLNDRAMEVRGFADWESALEWADRLRDQNWTVGWRLLAEDDGAPPP